MQKKYKAIKQVVLITYMQDKNFVAIGALKVCEKRFFSDSVQVQNAEYKMSA